MVDTSPAREKGSLCTSNHFSQWFGIYLKLHIPLTLPSECWEGGGGNEIEKVFLVVKEACPFNVWRLLFKFSTVLNFTAFSKSFLRFLRKTINKYVYLISLGLWVA